MTIAGRLGEEFSEVCCDFVSVLLSVDGACWLEVLFCADWVAVGGNENCELMAGGGLVVESTIVGFAWTDPFTVLGDLIDWEANILLLLVTCWSITWLVLEALTLVIDASTLVGLIDDCNDESASEFARWFVSSNNCFLRAESFCFEWTVSSCFKSRVSSFNRWTTHSSSSFSLTSFSSNTLR